MRFDWNAFADGKEFTVKSCSEWKDYTTKQPLGTNVQVAITKDDTDYHQTGNNQFTNLGETLTFKVNKKLNIAVNSVVLPVNPTVTAYGKDRNGNFSSFLNMLSVKCDDIKVL